MVVTSCRAFSIRNTSYSLLSSNISFSSSNLSHSSNISDGEWIVNSISLVIFVLALLGNTAALLVMFGSRGPVRLTNNKYLVNLACADLLRACFMPFTIIARMKRNFMFGAIICKVLPIVQGLSVAVDVFTLVCISVERYIAICRPLLILKLQSLRFANLLNGLILFLIWTLGLLTALPNIFMYNLCSLPTRGRFKCEKVNPQYFDDRFYMVTIVVFYFLIPMLVMLILYTLIICKMYKNNTAMRMRSFKNNYPSKTQSISSSPPGNQHDVYHQGQSASSDHHQFDINEQKLIQPSSFDISDHRSSYRSSNRSRSGLNDDDPQLRSSWPRNINHLFNNNQLSRKRAISNPLNRQSSKERKRSKRLFPSNQSHTSSTKSRLSSSSQGAHRMDRHRRKALKLLIVIIVEFFVCWTPLFIYHTFGTFDKRFYPSMPKIFVDLILLFSFASLLSNPFTYYFMSKRYRAVLYAYLSSCYWKKDNKDIFNKKNQEARQVIRALLLHQQQNSPEYKQKTIKKNAPSPNHIRYHPKFRSNTLQ